MKRLRYHHNTSRTMNLKSFFADSLVIYKFNSRQSSYLYEVKDLRLWSCNQQDEFCCEGLNQKQMRFKTKRWKYSLLTHLQVKKKFKKATGVKVGRQSFWVNRLELRNDCHVEYFELKNGTSASLRVAPGNPPVINPVSSC